jgi:hypothetical protein
MKYGGNFTDNAKTELLQRNKSKIQALILRSTDGKT